LHGNEKYAKRVTLEEKEQAMIASNVEGLCAAWLDAKRAEDAAKRQRLEVEKAIAQALDVKSEGAITHKLENYKVTLTQPIYRKVDPAKWDGVKTLISANFWPIKTIIEADATGCKYLANNEPGLWAMIAGAFTVTPGKIGVDVKAVDNE
jgi:hypothetical protein